MSPSGRRQLIVIVLVSVSTLKLTDATIIVSPKDTEAVVGTSVIFNCSTPTPEIDVQWDHFPIVGGMKVIYAYGKISSEYADRFTVQNGHNLHIASVTLNDTGTFQCQDDYGQGDKRRAELSVLETNLTCKSHTNLDKVIGKNPCGIEPSQVTLSCSVQFQGHNTLILEWKENGNETAITSGVSKKVQGNLVLYNLTLKGDSIVNGSSYNCRSTKATSKSASCNSGTITIIGDGSFPAADEPRHVTNNMDPSVAVIIWIVVTFLFYALGAGFAWHKFIKKTKPQNEEGTESQYKISIFPFIIIMAIPFCIGFLLWYLHRLICHRKKKKTQKDQKEMEERNLQNKTET